MASDYGTVRRIAFPLLVLLFSHVAAAAEIVGRVIGIVDGDTLTILDAGKQQTKIRLAEIDAPEMHQPYGARAKQALAALVFGRDVRIVVVDIDRYGRTVGRIYAGTLDVSAEMVREGAAWVFLRYNHDPSLLDRGREPGYPGPPAQIRTGGIPAYGSHLGCLTAKR